ncbi:MAG: MASE1 domain-containing protein, partial [Oceanospirillum sp.]|nr:MASE1 domain-containing protein [Oceanospirillum sp.]
MPHFFLVVLLVISVNIFAGLLGLQLAIPPGYATAIWPPSGVALASALIWRTPGLVGVWLASFLVNILNQHGFSLPSFSSALAIGWIASASTFQALVGAYLVRRFVGYPT